MGISMAEFQHSKPKISIGGPDASKRVTKTHKSFNGVWVGILNAVSGRNRKKITNHPETNC